ncbi:MAG: hypothetical protein PSX80_00055 [bacterium]|nr:hypothetical protein [bacterium]
MKTFCFTLFSVVLFASAVSAQTYNSSSGGYNTGYGTVYGSFGLAMATQNLYNSTQMQMQRSMARQAMINKWGLAAVEKAEREAKSGKTSSAPAASASPKIEVPPPPIVRNHGVFRPDPTVDTGKAFADALGDTAAEKAMIKSIFTNTKAAYQRETLAKTGWKNNIAGGMTFFAVTAMTVYRDGAEPPDEAVETFYRVMNQSLDDMPEFGKVSNKEKQAYNNVMIGFAGLLLAGYMEGKQNNDAATLKLYSQLAGELIKMVLKVEPDRLQLKDGWIVIV